jgi:hypothetical protein
MTSKIHSDPQDPHSNRSRRCTATSADGSPCRAWAVHGSDPPRCAPHGGGRAPACAPLGNQNARTHGFYATTRPPAGRELRECTIECVIADLYDKQQSLSRYIDEKLDELSPANLARLLGIHAQSCSRLGRLLRDRDALTGGFSAEMDRIIEQTLTELGEEWGVELT